jgi:ABC-2 type transport system ATP-binding protein
MEPAMNSFSDMPPAISVRNLSKTFNLPAEKIGTLRERLFKGRIRAEVQHRKTLEDINFDVQEGEFFGIIGRNGSGKSTLLKILAGIYRPDPGGEVVVNGRIAPMLELGVGFNPELTGRENVHLSSIILGLSPSQIKERYQSVVEFSELHDFMELQVKHYSSGMAVRLAFAVAMQIEAPIMLLDEVLAVGDFIFAEKCFALFEKYKEEKKTIVLVAHDPESMKRFADRILWIHNSKLAAIGKPEEVLKAYKQIG